MTSNTTKVTEQKKKIDGGQTEQGVTAPFWIHISRWSTNNRMTQTDTVDQLPR